MAIGACFHYFLLARALSLDVKGQNLKAQLSTSENIALRAFGKNGIFFDKKSGFQIANFKFFSNFAKNGSFSKSSQGHIF